MAVVATVVPKEEGALRLRTGLTITTAKLLPNVQRCYKCHMLGHMATKRIVVML